MELKRILAVVRRWVWLLVIGMVVGALGGFTGSLLMKPLYRATTEILVTLAGQSQNSDVTYLNSTQLTQTYIELLSSRSVLDAVSKRLGYAVGPSQIASQQVQTSQIIKITVEDHDPKRVATIANTLVEVLVEKNDELQSGRYSTMTASLQAQKTQIESQISTIQSEISQASAPVPSLLQTTQNLYQQIYLSILTSLENVSLAKLQDTPNVVQIDIAAVPLTPVQPKPFLYTLL